MYLNHFGLQQFPFTLTPNTEFFLDYGNFKEALDVLECAIFTGEGFTKVTGEVGTGKTLLCRKLLKSLDESYVTAHIPNPPINSVSLHRALATELGIKSVHKFEHSRLLERITNQIMAINAEGKQVALLMDEAQALSDDSLEAVRLLSNLETEKNKLLQLVLFGQPELDSRLRQDHLRQLRQRILFSYKLNPLTLETLNVYVHHRLQVAGYQADTLFNKEALKLLQRSSRGVPRLINVLAHKALLVAFGRGDTIINALHIRRAIADTDDVNTLRRKLEMAKPLFGFA